MPGLTPGPAMDLDVMQPRVEEAAALMAALSQPTRLWAICQLLEGEKTVQDLADLCGLSQPAMSHHLARLRADGLVTTRRDGVKIYYGLAGDEVRKVLHTLHGLYCA